jgi:hypothetical protein
VAAAAPPASSDDESGDEIPVVDGMSAYQALLSQLHSSGGKNAQAVQQRCVSVLLKLAYRGEGLPRSIETCLGVAKTKKLLFYNLRREFSTASGEGKMAVVKAKGPSEQQHSQEHSARMVVKCAANMRSKWEGVAYTVWQGYFPEAVDASGLGVWSPLWVVTHHAVVIECSCLVLER